MSEPLNIMTEAEAKTKWCPFARCASTASNRFNIEGAEPSAHAVGPCIASACMAWRWRGTNTNDGAGGPMHWADREYGFCGLAGTTP